MVMKMARYGNKNGQVQPKKAKNPKYVQNALKHENT